MGEGFLLLGTIPFLKCDSYKNLTNQSIPNLYLFATFTHFFSLPGLRLRQINAHNFCFHLAYVATAKLTY